MSPSDKASVWTVVKVPFPYTDRPVHQSRPALVVARTAEAAGLPLLWVLMITSAANRGWPGDVLISDTAAAGLPAPSLVRTEKIATVDARDATPLGRLPVPDRTVVAARLRGVLVTLLAHTA
jgi:mRNA interferase MazF